MLSLKEKLAGFNGSLPLSQASTLPSLWYLDAEISDLELKKVFLGNWHLAARKDQLSENGSFVTTRVGREPVLLTRDKEGTLRALSNVCRHRATQIERRDSGKTHSLVCRYHGWSYDLSGQLRGTPEWDGVENFCTKDVSLPSWEVDTFGPWVFVRWQENKKETLENVLSPLKSLMPIDLETYRFYKRVSYSLNCNWKVFVDNYLDGGYHIRTIHPDLSNLIQYSTYRSEIFSKASCQISPLKENTKGEFSSVRAGKDAYYWWLYPNLMVNVYEQTVDTNLVLPTGVGTCDVWIDFYYQKDLKDPDTFMSESIRAAHVIQLEDVDICEDAYRGLKSQSYSTGRFSFQKEGPGYHFHRLLATNLRD